MIRTTQETHTHQKKQHKRLNTTTQHPNPYQYIPFRCIPTISKMMSRNVSLSAILATLLAAPAAAFMPSSRPSHSAATKSSLSMSAALIVQNKGGGHGELGESFFGLLTYCDNKSKTTPQYFRRHMIQTRTHTVFYSFLYRFRFPTCQEPPIQLQNHFHHNPSGRCMQRRHRAFQVILHRYSRCQNCKGKPRRRRHDR
jgi:hypothetical protein